MMSLFGAAAKYIPILSLVIDLKFKLGADDFCQLAELILLFMYIPLVDAAAPKIVVHDVDEHAITTSLKPIAPADQELKPFWIVIRLNQKAIYPFDVTATALVPDLVILTAVQLAGLEAK